mmetsp:Transcript_38774/g.93721  ORF Transcript_38774/g.93721 Transcript_38774/m.93721 type:complete len:512 (+) Transcript_38774:54-1589(+)
MSRVRRKGEDSRGSSSGGAKKQKTIDLGWNRDDEDIVSSEDEENLEPSLDDEELEEEETLEAKKIRLAREYLRKLETADSDDSSSSSSEDDESDAGYDRIGVKLQRERLKREGTLERAVADKVHSCVSSFRESLGSVESEEKSWIQEGKINLLRGHDLTPTCVALQSDGTTAISGSKDHSVILWDVEQQKKSLTLCKSWKKQPSSELSRGEGEVLSVACSDDRNYAAIGRRDATVSIYDVRAGKNNLVKTFTGHKGPITTLAFRTQSLQLFSGSEDRCIRHYNLSELMYVETLFGHQFGVTSVDCHRKERPISVGRDRTARAWKLAEDTHLIFRGGARVSPADCVRVMKDDWFLTGHDDGSLSLWMTDKKKAVKTFDQAHGVDGSVGRGIYSLASLRGSDLAVSGSYDGYLRLWKVAMGSTLDSRGMEELNRIPLSGYVNGIAVGPKARFCVAACGQEPKLGRWHRVPKAKNRLAIVQMRWDNDDESEEEEGDEMNANSGSELESDSGSEE